MCPVRPATVRAQHRTNIQASVLVHWKERSGYQLTSGTTDNLSTKGVYVTTDNCPPLGKVVRCRFLLAMESTDGCELDYEAIAIGRVCRVDYQHDLPSGFAVRLRVFLLKEPQL